MMTILNIYKKQLLEIIAFKADIDFSDKIPI